jgi:hypothetical protein
MEVLALVLGCILIWVGVFGAGSVEGVGRVRIPRADKTRRLRAFVLGVALVLLVVGSSDSARTTLRTALDSLPRRQAPDSTTFALTTDTTPAAPAAAIPAPADTATAGDTTAAPTAEPVPDFDGFRQRMRVTWTVYDITYVGEMELNGIKGSLLVSYDRGDGQQHRVLQDLRLERRNDGWYYAGSTPRDPASQEPSDTYQPDFFHVSFNGGDWKFDRACDVFACTDLVAAPIS